MRRGALLLALLALLPACVRRTIQVRSDPPRARVFLDGTLVGETPHDIPFTYYGTREIVIRAPGRAPARLLVEIDPPWWQLLPFDFVTEILIPWEIADERRVYAALAPAPPASIEELRARAASVRAAAAAK